MTQRAVEQLVLAAQRVHGPPASVLWPFLVFRPRERPAKIFLRLIRALFEGAPFTLHRSSDHHRRSFTFVDDDGVAGLALDQHARCVSEVFNLGNPASMSTVEVIALAEWLFGRRLRVQQVPERRGDQRGARAHVAKIHDVLGFAYGARVVHPLGDERVGQYNIVRAGIGVFTILAELGVTQHVLHELAEDDAQITWHDPYRGEAGVLVALTEADVALVSSLSYGNSPNSIFEAIACGRPVVAACQGGMAELVQHGVNGLTFSSENAGALVGWLHHLATERAAVARLWAGIGPVETAAEAGQA